MPPRMDDITAYPERITITGLDGNRTYVTNMDGTYTIPGDYTTINTSAWIKSRTYITREELEGIERKIYRVIVSHIKLDIAEDEFIKVLEDDVD